MTVTRSRPPVRRVRPFTPAQESPALLSERTVGRAVILDTLDRRLLSAATTKSRAHTLLIGPRGSGKTHLVSVAIHRALKRPEVARQLAFVRFDEDVVGISRYTDILAEALAQLSPATTGGRRFVHSERPEGAVADALAGRVLVLVIENLDRVFQAIGKSGQQNFRAWVETTDQVMVLATAPLLFPGVQDRAMPWWGNFGLAHLDELDLDEGRQLLIHLAHESGDEALAEFIATDKGESRLRALSSLAGGSPRIWTILSECLTVELLDELVPAVETLLEGLVPYYQQLLWDLSPVEQRLIRVLADGAHQAATVAELADAAGVGQRVAATTLGRLADIRWVSPEKAPELDQRSTWYRLREPMLRHHFHYRSATDQPLPLIVEILKAWYDPAERRAQLARVESASQAERFLVATFGSERSVNDGRYNDHDADRLLAEARQWTQGAQADSRTRDAGILIDLAVCGVRKGPAAMRKLLARRDLSAESEVAATALVEACRDNAENGDEADQVGNLLRLAAASALGRTRLVLELISACWDGPSEPAESRDRLEVLVDASSADNALGLNIRREGAYWTGEAGDALAARDQFAALAPAHVRVLGAEHRETLIVRSDLADWSGMAGDAVAARDQNVELVPLLVRVMGAEHRQTLIARSNLAYWSGAAGDAVAARDQYTELMPLLVGVLGAEDRGTLTTRSNLARWTDEAGDAVAARDQYAELASVRARAQGIEHRDTLIARMNLAYLSEPAAGIDIAAEVLQLAGLRPEANRDLIEAARALLVSNLREAVAESRRTHEPETPEAATISELGLGGLLRAAALGSAEALVRLPSELVPIVESLRAERADSNQPARATT